MANRCVMSRPKCPSTNSWWKRIALISRLSRSAGNVANRPTLDWSRRKLPGPAAFRSKKLLALRPQPRNASSDLTGNEDRQGEDWEVRLRDFFVGNWPFDCVLRRSD